MTLHRRELGQSLAEFALVIPIFLIIIFGIIDFGRYAYATSTLSNGAREAARIGSVGARPDECSGLSRAGCVERIASDRSWGLAGDQVEADVTCERVSPGAADTPEVPVADCRTGDILHVRLTSTFTLMTPVVAQATGEIEISGDSRVTVNQ